MTPVRLGIDLGERPGEPEGLWDAAHLAHVACGGHAGDAASMAEAIARCLRRCAWAGAHPSYPDREGFGRRSVAMSNAALEEEVRRQCAALGEVGWWLKVPLRHAKPHGALYHAAAEDPGVARAFVAGVRSALGPVAIVGPPSGALAEAAAREGMAYWREGFTDRGYDADGRLLPRGVPGALIEDPAEAARQAGALVERGGVDVLCVHGDTPRALAVARAVRAALDGRPAPVGRP